jgi:hypothetical protein
VGSEGGPVELDEHDVGTIATELLRRSRSDDAVGRVGSGTFGVIMRYRPSAVDLSQIEDRLARAVKDAVSPSRGDVHVRSAFTTATGDDAVSPGDVFLEAVRGLGAA